MGRTPGVFGTVASQHGLFTALACLHLAVGSVANEALWAIPSTFHGEIDRTAGLQAWGHMLGSAMMFNKAGDGMAAAQALATLIQDAQHQVALQSVALAESGGSPKKAAALRKAKALHSATETGCPSENPLECWVFEMVETLNKHTKTAVSDAWRTVKGALGLGTSRKELNSNGGPSEDAGHSTLEEEEEELPPFLSDVEAVDIGQPKFFNFEWEPFSTEIAGVTVEANLFNVAPCAVLVNARGVKVETTLIKVEPTLFNISPGGVSAEAAVIEVSPKLISVSPAGTTLDIELPGHIHVDGSAIEVAPVGEENDIGPGANRDD